MGTIGSVSAVWAQSAASTELTGQPPAPPGMGQGKEQSPLPLARERGRVWARGEAAAASSDGFGAPLAGVRAHRLWQEAAGPEGIPTAGGSQFQNRWAEMLSGGQQAVPLALCCGQGAPSGAARGCMGVPGSAVPWRSQLHGLGTAWERGASPGLCTALPKGLLWGAPGGPPWAGDPSPGAASARPAPALPAAVQLKFHLF